MYWLGRLIHALVRRVLLAVARVVLATFCILASAGPLSAQADLGRIFAECAGRFSAAREHAWLIGDDAAEMYESRRSDFVSLLDATVDAQMARRLLMHRIDVKIAHAALLTAASFSKDDTRARRARTLAAYHIGTCERLLLQG